jgi:hypothetical protein
MTPATTLAMGMAMTTAMTTAIPTAMTTVMGTAMLLTPRRTTPQVPAPWPPAPRPCANANKLPRNPVTRGMGGSAARWRGVYRQLRPIAKDSPALPKGLSQGLSQWPGPHRDRWDPGAPCPISPGG